MLVKHQVLIIIFAANIKHLYSLSSGPSNFIFHNFTDCAEKPTPINISFVPKWLNQTYQVLNGYAKVPMSLGDNVLGKISGKMLIHNRWIPVVNFSETLCKELRNYVGPLRVDVMNAIGLSGDTCPIPAGRYHWENVHLDWRKSRIPVLAFGKFNVMVTLYEISTNILYACLNIVLENKLM